MNIRLANGGGAFLKIGSMACSTKFRRGRPRTIGDDQIAAVIERTLRSTTDATYWSIRSMAGAAGFSHTTIRRIWNACGLQPHRAETFKLSSDLLCSSIRSATQFGLYLSPPNRALVLSVDEKSQIQALDREQPVLSMMPSVPERRTHSYVRATTKLHRSRTG